MLKKFQKHTAVLIGLWVRSRLKRAGRGSHGASNEKGGESKEVHDSVLGFEDL